MIRFLGCARSDQQCHTAVPNRAMDELGPTDLRPDRVRPDRLRPLPSWAQPLESFFSLWRVVSCLFFSLWGFSRVLLSLTGGRFVEFGGVFEGVDPQMCTFGLSGCRVKPRRSAAGAPLFSGFGPTLRGSTPNRAKIGRA